MSKFKISFLFLIVLLLSLAAGFYFWNNIINVFYRLGEKLESIKDSDLGNIVQEFRREVLTPSPLRVDGPETQAVLAKERVISQTNVQRISHGLSALVENSQLSAAALAKAQDMFANQYFDHVSPAGLGPGELVRMYGYDYITTGENLILGNFASEEAMVQAWMDSPGHRANILNQRFKEIGVAVIKGVYQGQSVWIGVQQFGLHISTCQSPSENLKNQIEINRNHLAVLEHEINAKKSEIDDTNPRSPRHNDLVDEYNQLVAEYNTLVQQIKDLVASYNAQVNVFNQCVAGN